MAEDVPESGSENSAGGVDPVAAALALGSASRQEADAFLKKQGALIDEQRHHLRKQFVPALWEKWLGVLLRLATAAVGIAAASAIAWLIWDASHSRGLVIEPFSVPPDLAARGVTGEVVAAKLLDRIGAMEDETISLRAPQSYANSWTRDDIKIDIPETGVSLGELDRFLRDRLGHDTHVTGEAVRTDTGIALTMRVGTEGTGSAAGAERDLDALVQSLGEAVYRLTQPYRFAAYLAAHGRGEEGLAILQTLAQSGSVQDRPWALNRLALNLRESTGIDQSLAALEQIVVEEPQNNLALANIAQSQILKGRPEAVIAASRQDIAVLSASSSLVELRAEFIPVAKILAQADIDVALGDFHHAAQEFRQGIDAGYPARFDLPAQLARAFAGEHDIGAAVPALDVHANDLSGYDGSRGFYFARARMEIAAEKADWPGVLSEVKAIDPILANYRGPRSLPPTTTAPLVALAEARLGKFGDAEAQISGTPTDCYPCLIARAQTADLQGQGARADWWFDRAVNAGPSIPFAYHEWGRALLARGDAAGAIAKFKLATQKGPHFADPLEGWGEALMAQNRSDLAVGKFTESAKYAPNWGRLHLKWGEALAYAGKKADAQRQFALAATLDLTPAEKSELARMISHV